MRWERVRPCVGLTSLDDFEDDTALCSELVNKHYFREESDEEDEEEEEGESVDEIEIDND